MSTDDENVGFVEIVLILMVLVFISVILVKLDGRLVILEELHEIPTYSEQKKDDEK